MKYPKRASSELDRLVCLKITGAPLPEGWTPLPYSKELCLPLQYLERNCPDLCFKRINYGIWEVRWGQNIVGANDLAVAMCLAILEMK